MVDPTDEEIAAWADSFIRQNAYNRAVAVRIATEAAKWVRGQRVQVGWYYEMPVHGRNGLRVKLSDAELAEFRRVAHVWPVYRTEREAVPGSAGMPGTFTAPPSCAYDCAEAVAGGPRCKAGECVNPSGVEVCPSCGMKAPRHLAACAAIAGVAPVGGKTFSGKAP